MYAVQLYVLVLLFTIKEFNFLVYPESESIRCGFSVL